MSEEEVTEQDNLDSVEVEEKPSVQDQAPVDVPAPVEPSEDQPPVEGAEGAEGAEVAVEGEGAPEEEGAEGIPEEGAVTEEVPAEPEEEAEPEVVYGGVDGPDSMYITVISSDRHHFVIKRSLAILSGTIRQMLISPGPETKEEERNIIRLTIPSHLVERVCSYLIYRDVFSKSETSVDDFDFFVEPYLAFPLLMAANFLTC